MQGSRPIRIDMGELCRLSARDGDWGRVARSLVEMSRADFDAGVEAVRQFAQFPGRMAHLAPYMRAADVRPPEALQLCMLVVEARGKGPDARLEDAGLAVAVPAIVQGMLGGDPGCSRLLDRIVRGDSYNSAVNLNVAMSCGRLLRGMDRPEVLDVFSALLDSSDPRVQMYAEHFLLCAPEHGSLLPKIMPLLGKAAGIRHDPDANPAGPALVGYLTKFWKEMPNEAAVLLDRVCRNNPLTTVWNGSSPAAPDAIVDMLESGLLDSESRQILLGTLNLFARAGWPQAGQVLEAAERHV